MKDCYPSLPLCWREKNSKNIQRSTKIDCPPWICFVPGLRTIVVHFRSSWVFVFVTQFAFHGPNAPPYSGLECTLLMKVGWLSATFTFTRPYTAPITKKSVVNIFRKGNILLE